MTCIEQRDMLLKFVTSYCMDCHPDEIPAWWLAENGQEFHYGGDDALEEFDADEAFDSYRDKYGHLDTDSLRTIVEEARKIVNTLNA